MANEARYTDVDSLRKPVALRLKILNWRVGSRWCATIAFWLGMNVLLFAPSRHLPDVNLFGAFQDKLGHLAVFGVLAALVRWSIPDRWGRGKRAGVVFAMLAAYGVATECIQAIIPNAERMFEAGDILMDCVGVALGMWSCVLLAERPSG